MRTLWRLANASSASGSSGALYALETAGRVFGVTAAAACERSMCASRGPVDETAVAPVRSTTLPGREEALCRDDDLVAGPMPSSSKATCIAPSRK